MAMTERVDFNSHEKLPTAAWFAKRLRFDTSNIKGNSLSGSGFQLMWKPESCCTEIFLADAYGTRIWELDEADPQNVRLKLLSAQVEGGFIEDPSVSVRTTFYMEGIKLPEYTLAFDSSLCSDWEKRPPENPMEYPLRRIREIDLIKTCGNNQTFVDVEASVNVFRNLKRAFFGKKP